MDHRQREALAEAARLRSVDLPAPMQPMTATRRTTTSVAAPQAKERLILLVERPPVGDDAAVLVVVRHAEAVKRHIGGVPDDQRPLTDRGRRQAIELVDVLTRWGPTRLLSSPQRRAIDTIGPTAIGWG